MPNWSHGQAGIAGALAAAGVALDRPDLVEAARLARSTCSPSATPATAGCGFDHRIPGQEGLDTLHLLLVPRAGRHVAAVRRAGPRRRARGRWPHAVRLGAGVPALAPRLRHPRAPLPRLLGQRRALLRYGGRRRRGAQRLAAARVRRGPRLRDHPRRRDRRPGVRRRRPCLLALRRAPQRRPAPPTRRRAGCRGRPGSRRTSSASPASSSRAATPPRSRGWTPGGRCLHRQSVG